MLYTSFFSLRDARRAPRIPMSSRHRALFPDMTLIRQISIVFTLAAIFAVSYARGLANNEATAGDTALQTGTGISGLSVLSDGDAARYRAIFKAQARGSWAQADAQIRELGNELLMGYVLHERYLHPTAYVSRYTELSQWLTKYRDHPNARAIHELARRKRPQGARLPPAPQKRRWRVEAEKQMAPQLAADYAANANPRRVRQIEGRVRYLCGEDRPTQALNFLNARAQRQHLTGRQIDRIRSWIAESYYYNGNLAKARLMAATSAAQNPEAAPLALWISGLIAWREGDYDTSFDHFSKMARLDYLDENLHAGANFWAARAALKIRQPTPITAFLQAAAAHPMTFYGQLAHAQLGTEPDYGWQARHLTEDQWARLRQGNTRIDRAAALAQIGQHSAAHTELRWAHGEGDGSLDGQLLRAAFTLRLPAAQLDIALALENRAAAGRSSAGSNIGSHPMPDAERRAGLYPVPDFAPATGFEIDRAVLFGLIRQESKFKPKATSRSGAKGLMQLMPRTASYVAGDTRLQYKSHASRLYDPAYNMQLGQSYVRYLLGHDSIDNNLVEMCIAYNWGPGNLRRWKKKTPIGDPLLMIESIPNHEARHFVDQVMTNIWIYRARLGQSAPSRDAMAAINKASYGPIDGQPGSTLPSDR